MPRKHLKTYKELAARKGYVDPLAYLFSRYMTHQRAGDHEKAQAIAWGLVPYGHGKAAPVDQEGQDVTTVVITLE